MDENQNNLVKNTFEISSIRTWQPKNTKNNSTNDLSDIDR